MKSQAYRTAWRSRTSSGCFLVLYSLRAAGPPWQRPAVGGCAWPGTRAIDPQASRRAQLFSLCCSLPHRTLLRIRAGQALHFSVEGPSRSALVFPFYQPSIFFPLHYFDIGLLFRGTPAVLCSLQPYIPVVLSLHVAFTGACSACLIVQACSSFSITQILLGNIKPSFPTKTPF